MKKTRILVIDDDVHSTRMVKLSLERTGRMRSGHSTIRRALDAARRCKPDLILLDICMPGTEAAKLRSSFERIRNSRGSPLSF